MEDHRGEGQPRGLGRAEEGAKAAVEIAPKQEIARRRQRRPVAGRRLRMDVAFGDAQDAQRFFGPVHPRLRFGKLTLGLIESGTRRRLVFE